MEQNIAEETKPQIYVWAKTERAGDVVTVADVEGEFTNFTDGSRIFTNMISEMLLEAKDENDAANISIPFHSVSVPGNSAPKNETAAPAPVKTTTGEVDVMLEMLKKISAKNTISMPLELNVPSKEVYELFKDQMDITKSDLNEHILALVLSQIDNLQEQLKPQAEEFIKQYYNGRESRTKTNGGTASSDRGSNSNAPDITY